MRLKSIVCALTPPRRRRSLILAYHSIASESPAAIPEASFRQQMDTLARTYRVVPLAAFVTQVSQGETGLATVTFDDGYRDCYERAFPVLQEMAFPFTVFLTTGFLQTGRCEWANAYSMLPPLNWRQVREMQRYGADMQCHTHEHRRWSEQSSAGIARDLKTSRRILEDHLGTPVSAFAYPYGQPHDIDGRGAFLLPACGFRLAVTTLHTTVDAIPDPFRIPRMSVNGDDTPGDFVQHLRGKRDILASLERAKSACLALHRARKHSFEDTTQFSEEDSIEKDPALSNPLSDDPSRTT